MKVHGTESVKTEFESRRDWVKDLCRDHSLSFLTSLSSLCFSASFDQWFSLDGDASSSKIHFAYERGRISCFPARNNTAA